LRNQNRAFPLRLVDVPPADEILRKVPKDMACHSSKFVSAI